MTFEGALRAAGTGVAGMYGELTGLSTKALGAGETNAAASMQHWEQAASQDPTAINRINAGASHVVTCAFQGAVGLGEMMTKMFQGITSHRLSRWFIKRSPPEGG
jgi:hypothetical protein